MKRLLLLRHAKAERGGADDLKRALEKRGIKDSARMGRFLRDDIYIPELILSSNSTRTRQTLEDVVHQLVDSIQQLADRPIGPDRDIANLRRVRTERVPDRIVRREADR